MISNRQPSLIREIRDRFNISQDTMAKDLGYSGPQFISNAERGICTLPNDVIPKIGKLYGRKYAMALVTAKIDDYSEQLLNLKF